MMTFTIAPEYTIATDYAAGCVTLDEWSGKSVELFTKAMGRPADHIDVCEIAGRKIEEHQWHGK